MGCSSPSLHHAICPLGIPALIGPFSETLLVIFYHIFISNAQCAAIAFSASKIRA